MKPQYIKNKTAQRLRDGFHTDLMAFFEESIDLYTEKNFMRGHDSFFEDASVHAYNIAEKLGYLDENDTRLAAVIIEDYFNSIKPQ
jgi:hypothetical protein